jgi:two-component system phosphate regulon response regulator PhoB
MSQILTVEALLEELTGEPVTRRPSLRRESSPEKPVLLLVESRPAIRRQISVTLEAVGYRVVETQDAYEAADWLRRHGAPALAMVAASLPGIEGWQYLRTLRNDELTASIPLVLLTGSAGFWTRWRSHRAGANHCLAVPEQIDRLLPIVRGIVPV